MLWFVETQVVKMIVLPPYDVDKLRVEAPESDTFQRQQQSAVRIT